MRTCFCLSSAYLDPSKAADTDVFMDIMAELMTGGIQLLSVLLTTTLLCSVSLLCLGLNQELQELGAIGFSHFLSEMSSRAQGK